MQGKRQIIHVYGWEGDQQGYDIQATVYGNLALSYATYWQIWHVPTGHLMALHLHREHADEAIQGLLAVGDWNFTDRAAVVQLPYLSAAQTFVRALRKRIETEKREYIEANQLRKTKRQ